MLSYVIYISYCRCLVVAKLDIKPVHPQMVVSFAASGGRKKKKKKQKTPNEKPKETKKMDILKGSCFSIRIL